MTAQGERMRGIYMHIYGSTSCFCRSASATIASNLASFDSLSDLILSSSRIRLFRLSIVLLREATSKACLSAAAAERRL